MHKRGQRRRKAILPIKVILRVDGETHLAHTIDISASGARLIVPAPLTPGMPIAIECKRRRALGTVIWSRAIDESMYDYQVGVHLPEAGSVFWGVTLPLREDDISEESLSTPLTQVIDQLSRRV